MPEWDEIFKEEGMVFTEPHPEMKRISEMLQERGLNRILDLGCGTGRHLVFLSHSGFDVYGFDASPTAINLASEWLESENLGATVRLHRMEEPFPYETDFFDAVISIQVIHHNLMKDIVNTIREIERVLCRGGLLFASVPVLKTGPVKKEDDWELEKIEDGTFIPRKGPESGIPHHYFTDEEIVQVFSSFNLLEHFIDTNDHRCILAIKK
jgi:SAM-dependent methyltransferase